MSAEADLANEVSHFDQLPADAWLVRSCELLQEELKECRRPKGRFHQYFIHGELADCSQWRDDVRRCLRWRQHADADAMAALVESERARRDARLAAHRRNDVWEPRDGPPPGWNDPLPEHLERKRQSSFLHRMQQADEAGRSAADAAPPLTDASRCVVQ